MFTSNEIEALSMSFDSRMKQLETDVMSDIIRRISINGEITRSADWQINRLYELGVAKDDIKKTIQKALNLKDEEVEELFRKAIESGYARNEDIYKKLGKDIVPFSENKVLQQYISSVAKQTAEEMRNLSQSLGFAVKNPDGTVSFTPIAEYYQNTLDNAINGIANGVFDYNTAIKRAVNELTKSGLRSVDYASGWSNRVDVAARRAVMTGMGQLTGKVNEMNAEELGTDMYEVSWHGGARPS
ncbi:MAG: minor capsid protein, partial [Clostridia bacterium]|nr:minor capsid protein [Clostridia bacterium]